ncbi:MAG TPA: potassium channel family protein [Anaeromyxobacteraceae bacterium]|nr:potassium channel family protein [Anaeromyxobacteraceae bacterium]
MAKEPFLRSRAGRIALLAMLVFSIFVVPVLMSLAIVPARAGDFFFAATMIVAMVALSRGDGRRFVVTVAAAAFFIQFFRVVEHGDAVVVADAALSALAMGTFAVLVVRDVFEADPVPDRLLDVILAYLLVGATFAFLYEIANVLSPGALTMEGGPMTGADYIYFSITTMTSVGFGDALPRHPATRALAMAQALTGQLYVATLIARFVNVATSRRGGRARDDGDPG